MMGSTIMAGGRMDSGGDGSGSGQCNRERASTLQLTWRISDNEIESGEEKGPSGLSRGKSLVIVKVFKVSMIHDDFKLMIGSLQQVSPLFES